MLKPEFTGKFRKDYKLALKRGCDPKKFEKVLTLSRIGFSYIKSFETH